VLSLFEPFLLVGLIFRNSFKTIVTISLISIYTFVKQIYKYFP
jgi:hypothetical protein